MASPRFKTDVELLVKYFECVGENNGSLGYPVSGMGLAVHPSLVKIYARQVVGGATGDAIANAFPDFPEVMPEALPAAPDVSPPVGTKGEFSELFTRWLDREGGEVITKLVGAALERIAADGDGNLWGGSQKDFQKEIRDYVEQGRNQHREELDALKEDVKKDIQGEVERLRENSTETTRTLMGWADGFCEQWEGLLKEHVQASTEVSAAKLSEQWQKLLDEHVRQMTEGIEKWNLDWETKWKDLGKHGTQEGIEDGQLLDGSEPTKATSVDVEGLRSLYNKLQHDLGALERLTANVREVNSRLSDLEQSIERRSRDEAWRRDAFRESGRRWRSRSRSGDRRGTVRDGWRHGGKCVEKPRAYVNSNL